RSHYSSSLLFLTVSHPPISTLFPYTTLFRSACYVTNWPALHQTNMPTLGHTWSLSVEEQFYLLWPVLLYGMLRLRLSRRHALLLDRKSTRLNSSHQIISYAVFCLKQKQRTEQ